MLISDFFQKKSFPFPIFACLTLYALAILIMGWNALWKSILFLSQLLFTDLVNICIWYIPQKKYHIIQVHFEKALCFKLNTYWALTTMKNILKSCKYECHLRPMPPIKKIHSVVDSLYYWVKYAKLWHLKMKYGNIMN